MRYLVSNEIMIQFKWPESKLKIKNYSNTEFYTSKNNSFFFIERNACKHVHTM